jgi:hypothetical protein
MSSKTISKSEHSRDSSSGSKKDRKRKSKTDAESIPKHPVHPKVKISRSEKSPHKHHKYEHYSSEEEYDSDRGRFHSRKEYDERDSSEDESPRRRSRTNSSDRRHKHKRESPKHFKRAEKRKYSEASESDSEESENEKIKSEYIEVPVDKSMPPPVKYRDFIKCDEKGNPIPDNKKSKTVEPVPATAAEQTTIYKRMQRLLKKYDGKIPVVYIERGNRVYHPMDAAYIYAFPKKNSVSLQKYGFGDEDNIDKPGYILTELKTLRGKKPRKSTTKNGKKRRVGGKSWTELYMPDLDGTYKRLGCIINVNHRPCRLPSPETRKKGKGENPDTPNNDEELNEELRMMKAASASSQPAPSAPLPTSTPKNLESIDNFMEAFKNIIASNPSVKQDLAQFLQNQPLQTENV